MEYYHRVKIPEELIGHAGLEGLEADYTPEYLVEQEFIKDQSAVVEQPKWPLQRSDVPKPRLPGERGRGLVSGFGGPARRPHSWRKA